MSIENGNTNEQIAAIDAEIVVLEVQIKAEEAARFQIEWTREVTVTRRTEWNTMVKSGKFGKTRVDWSLVRKQEQIQDWTTEQMKKAIQMWGL